MRNSPEALKRRSRRRKAERKAATLARRKRTAARCLRCPDDPVILRPLWTCGALLDPREFVATLADGSFPAGSVWSLPETGRVWRVWGNELHAVDGGAVLRAVEIATQRVKLMEVRG